MQRQIRALALCLLGCLALPAAYGQSATYSIFTAFPGDTTIGGGPVSQLVQNSAGDFYGTTIAAGEYSEGAVYRANPSGTLSAVYQNCPSSSSTPCVEPSSFILGSDGNFYGVSEQGGTDGYGAVYKLSPSGTLTVLHSFTDTGGTDGSYPTGVLVQGIDGNFYGEASQGGNLSDCTGGFAPNGCGLIFKITPAGAFSIVYTFTGGTDAAAPTGGLIQGRDGNFYGVTALTLFQVSPTGAFKTLATSNGSTQGYEYIGPPVEDASGNFYTVSQYNGAGAGGVVVKVTPGGTLSIVYSFCAESGCPDGILPLTPLQLLTNGNLVGTNSEDGDDSCAQGFGCGTIFEVTPAGKFTVLYTFDDSNSNGILAGGTPISGMDGNLYGTATNGDVCNECGVIYKLAHSPALPPGVKLSLSSSSVAPNSPVTLTYQVSQATTDTAQLCYAFGGGAGGGSWSGRQTGTYNSSTAVYSGSVSITPTEAGTYTYGLTCGGTVSGSVVLTAGTTAKTTTSLAASPNPVYIGQSVTVTATVKKASGSGTPTGSVTFAIPGLTLGTANLNGSGVASLTASTAGEPAGTYPVTATYNGDSADGTSSSPALDVSLKSAAGTTTTLAVSPTTVTPPANVTFTATVASSGGTASGTVTFSANGETLGTATLNSKGVATLTGSSSGVPAGNYPAVAKYNGATGFSGSTSNTVEVTVK